MRKKPAKINTFNLKHKQWLHPYRNNTVTKASTLLSFLEWLQNQLKWLKRKPGLISTETEKWLVCHSGELYWSGYNLIGTGYNPKFLAIINEK